MSEVRLEQMLGRRVVDIRGRPVGRIEEVRAERQDGEWIVREYVLGAAGLLERLAAVRWSPACWGAWRRGPSATRCPGTLWISATRRVRD